MCVLSGAIDLRADELQFCRNRVVAAQCAQAETLQIGRKSIEFLIRQSQDILQRELDVFESGPFRVREYVRPSANAPSHGKGGHRRDGIGLRLAASSVTRVGAPSHDRHDNGADTYAECHRPACSRSHSAPPGQ
jgi:hypothetical protein